MKEKFYKLGVAVGIILIVTPLLYMLISLFPAISYNKNLSSAMMNIGYFILGSTLVISFILNKKIAFRQHFWKLPAGTLFVFLGLLYFLQFPRKVEFIIFAIAIIIFIAYSKYKKIL